MAVHTDPGSHFVRFCVDHTDVAGFSVHHINLVLSRIYCQARWALSDRHNRLDSESAQIDNGYAVTAAVADVGIFAVVRYRVGCLPAAAQEKGKQAKSAYRPMEKDFRQLTCRPLQPPA